MVFHMFVDEHLVLIQYALWIPLTGLGQYRLKKDFRKEFSPNKLRTTDTMIVPQMMAGDDNQNKNKK